MQEPNGWLGHFSQEGDLAGLLASELKPVQFEDSVDGLIGMDNKQDSPIDFNYDDTEFNSEEFNKLVHGLESVDPSDNEVSVDSCQSLHGAVVMTRECDYKVSVPDMRSIFFTNNNEGMISKSGDNVKCRMLQSSEQKQDLIEPVDEEVPVTANPGLGSANNNTLLSPNNLDTMPSSSNMPLLSPFLMPQQIDKNKRNAEIAKRNREKKKRQFQELETENQRLKTVMHQLVVQRQNDAQKIKDLESDVSYYQDVLKHHSDIAGFLQKFTANNSEKKPQLQLMSNIRKRQIDSEHDYGSHSQPK